MQKLDQSQVKSAMTYSDSHTTPDVEFREHLINVLSRVKQSASLGLTVSLSITSYSIMSQLILLMITYELQLTMHTNLIRMHMLSKHCFGRTRLASHILSSS